MTDSPPLTVRISSSLRREVDALADALDRPRSWVVNKAIEDFVEVQKWQIADMKKGLAEAEAGKFATEAEAKAAFGRIRRKLKAIKRKRSGNE